MQFPSRREIQPHAPCALHPLGDIHIHLTVENSGVMVFHLTVTDHDDSCGGMIKRGEFHRDSILSGNAPTVLILMKLQSMLPGAVISSTHFFNDDLERHKPS